MSTRHANTTSDAIPMPAHGLRAHTLPTAPGGPERALIAFDLAPGFTSALAALTAGQRPIVALALAGLSDREIAETLGRSRHTISNQLRRAYARLGVSTRIELCAQFGVSVRASEDDPAGAGLSCEDTGPGVGVR